MIYIDTGSTDVFYNFALEYYFACEKELSEPVFLFWRTEPTLMIGKYQNTFEEIDLSYAEEKGIEVVRRLSGGGTIYTDLGGWQFTFIEYGNDNQIHFTEFIAPIIDALKTFEVEAEFNGRNDLVIGGRKFSGNAQYKLKGNTIHHGSILFDTNIEEMVASTTVDPYKIISKSIKSVRERVTNIKDHLKQTLSAEEFSHQMVNYILGEKGQRYQLTKSDHRRILEIADEKFRPWQARFGANPKFSMTKVGRFAGGKLSISLDVKKNTITSAQVNGDFFGNDRAQDLAETLVGLPLEKETLISSLNQKGLADALYGISAEEIVYTILT